MRRKSPSSYGLLERRGLRGRLHRRGKDYLHINARGRGALRLIHYADANIGIAAFGGLDSPLMGNTGGATLPPQPPPSLPLLDNPENCGR
jgi:hypothetical protein